MNKIAQIIFFVSLTVIIACKKDSRQTPNQVVSYQVQNIIAPNTYLKYSYNELGFLSRVEGKDSDKSIYCDITYDKERMHLEYENRTADEKWDIHILVDPSTGYILSIDDGMYVASFTYDSTRFTDGMSRLVGSYYHGGKYKGDSLSYNIQYDDRGNLISSVYKGEKRDYIYDLNVEVESNVSSILVQAFWGRFDKIISYLPYTFGPPQKYLLKQQVSANTFYKSFEYVLDEHGRVKSVTQNGAVTTYVYLHE